MSADGLSEGWGMTQQAAGVSEATPPAGAYTETWTYLQIIFHTLLQHGVAIVSTSESAFDTLYYGPSSEEARRAGYSFECKNPTDTCWTEDNVDKEYYTTLLQTLRDASDVPRCNLNRCVLMGYSVGAQMASRWLEAMTPSLTPRGVVMVAGGSLYCYEYRRTELPDIFKPCADPDKLGCCPVGITEPRYIKGEEDGRHVPPVLLVQNINDPDADPFASSKYFEAAKKQRRDACLLRGNGDEHGAVSCQASPTVAFVLNALDIS
jgi:dienelactone hydrolase